ncbi:MAG: endolytic transglycosylase MltG [Bacteroidota bacterium]
MFKKIAIIGAALALIGGIVAFPKIMLYLDSRAVSDNATTVDFYIKKSISLKELATELVEKGVLENDKSFLKVGEYKGLNEKSIALGKYEIAPGTQIRNLLNGFTLNAAGNGNAEVEVNVTFNNCRFMSDLASKISEVLMVDSVELLAYLNNPNTHDKFGFSSEEFPAMFLPNTYKMYYDTDLEKFTARMAQEFKAFWTADRIAKLKKVGLKSPSECSTLASIIYSEQSKVAEEWPVIAGLYLNRLNQGIRLQSDPTFKFCWGKQLDGVQRLLFIHRDIDCPYNTYKYDGLPPGPICMPPTQVLNAVLNRDNNNYIFMMAKPDFSGRHDFSVDYSRHQQLASIYQKWLATLN